MTLRRMQRAASMEYNVRNPNFGRIRCRVPMQLDIPSTLPNLNLNLNLNPILLFKLRSIPLGLFCAWTTGR